jgi:hypothetical protein
MTRVRRLLSGPARRRRFGSGRSSANVARVAPGASGRVRPVPARVSGPASLAARFLRTEAPCLRSSPHGPSVRVGDSDRCVCQLGPGWLPRCPARPGPAYFRVIGR